MSFFDKWIIFDGDNTLWMIEHLYDDARVNLCKYLAARGVEYRLAEDFQRKRDSALYDTYGYSACRFARSFEDTALEFCPDISAQDVRHVRNIALEVFERKATLPEGLEQLLNELASSYKLGIITAGEEWVQRRRLDHFKLSATFEAVEIVEVKSATIFNVFCEKYLVNKAISWVIGDSLNSDVIPATQAGLNAILYVAKNWSPIEGTANQLPRGARKIDDLREIRNYLFT